LAEMTVEIVIDPNVRVAGNRTYAGFEDVTGAFVDDINVGDPVTVVEEESDVVGTATVYEIDAPRQLIYLTVDWPSLHRRTVEEKIAAAKAATPLLRASYLTPEGRRELVDPFANRSSPVDSRDLVCVR